MTLTLLVACTLVSGLLVGFIPALVDTLVKSWQARLTPTAPLDWAVRLFYFIWLPAMPLTGWMLDHWPENTKLILFCGLIGLIVAMAWLALVRSVGSLFGNMAFLGIAYSLVTTCTVRLMADALFERAAFAGLNVGFIFVAFGAWLGPELFSLAERWWGYRHGLLYLSLICIVPAGLAALSEPNHFHTPPALVDIWPEMIIHRDMALIAGIILVYFAIESCLEFWPEPYLKEIGYENRGVRTGMFIFWLAFIGTRAAAAWWLYEHPSQGLGLTVLLVIVAAMLLGNLVGGYDIGSGSFGFWLAGACYGPMLPCFIGIALSLLPNVPTFALGILLALSGLDTLIVRPLMQAYAANRPARMVMRVPTVLALLLAAPLVLLAFLRNS